MSPGRVKYNKSTDLWHRAAFTIKPLTSCTVWCLQRAQQKKISTLVIRNAAVHLASFTSVYLWIISVLFSWNTLTARPRQSENSSWPIEILIMASLVGHSFSNEWTKGLCAILLPTLQLILNREIELWAIGWAEMNDRVPKGSIWIVTDGILKLSPCFDCTFLVTHQVLMQDWVHCKIKAGGDGRSLAV